MADISSNKTIAKNTLFLYFRMFLTTIVAIYTARVNLSVLGIENHGLYAVVGSVASLFGFINSSLSGATSRFLTYELGRDDKKRLSDTFATALNIHIVLAIIVFVLCETIGVWFLENKMTISPDRMNAARWVFQLSIFSAMMSITQVPYGASLVAHEKMSVFAYMSILGVTLNLLICYMVYIIPFDKLIVYAVLVLLVSVSMRMTYRIYCIRHFEECHFKLIKDRDLIRGMLSFSGWDLFGNFSGMARTHGVNIVINLFYKAAVNSAAGFSSAVSGAVTGFSNNFMTAIKPSILKAYAIGDIEKMELLMINASKFSFCLIFLIATPVIFESDFIMVLWLKNPPQYAAVFCCWELILNICIVIFLPIMFGLHASGKIKNMSICNSIIWISILPITYYLFFLGYPPTVPYITKVFLFFIGAANNMYHLKVNIPSFSVRRYLSKAVLPTFLMAGFVTLITYVLWRLCGEQSWKRLIIICVESVTINFILAYFIMLSKDMRSKMKSIVQRTFMR